MILDPIQRKLQDLAIEAREKIKEKMQLDSLLTLHKLDPKKLEKFKVDTATDIYVMMRDKTELPHKLIRVEFEDGKIDYAIVIYNYILDPGMEGKIFAMKMKDYPRIKDYQLLADSVAERQPK